MNSFFFFLFLYAQSLYASIDTGTGADGACSQATIVAGTRTYNCTSLTIGAANSVFNAQAGSVVVIKVVGSVTISNTFNLNGGNGADGDAANTVKAGGVAGAGGSNGGASAGYNVNGTVGSGTGGGAGGLDIVSINNGTLATGGGGGGGSYGSVSATVASNGYNGTASAPGTSGAQGSTYGTNSLFESSFLGGSGGGAGGSSDDNLGTEISGSGGGGGGGAVHIVAGGDVTISGTINANGGNGGGNGGNDNAGGGGGSGGAIWIQSLGNIIISGTLNATGGTGGTNLSTLNGGSGGNGRIRLDDIDGNITGGGTVTPNATVNSIASLSASSNTLALESDISCAAREKLSWSHVMTFLLGCLILVSFKFRRAERFLVREKF